MGVFGLQVGIEAHGDQGRHVESLSDICPTGRYLLIPQGARLIGQYDSSVAFGQSRVLLMWKLKLASVPDDRPVKCTVELPAAVFRDLAAYAEAIGRENGQAAPEPAKLIVPMIQRFMDTDRAFSALRRKRSDNE